MTHAPGTSFRDRIRTGPPPIGTLITVPSPEIVEALSLAGMDWLFVDMEHGAIDISQTQNLIRAIRGDCHALVRVPENTTIWVRKTLDIGADGVVVPQVCSAEDALRAVNAARYPPAGQRGLGSARAHGYGLQAAAYVRSANEYVAVVIQVEHIGAVEAIDEILMMPGIDGVLIGPNDLSASMGLIGEVGHADVRRAIERVRVACGERSVPFGMFVPRVEEAATELARGTSFLAVGTEMSYLLAEAGRLLAMSRAGRQERCGLI